jgi:hypothetical protein
MAEFMIANMAPLMFGALVLFLLFGYPVAFALAANGIVFGLIGIELGLLTPALFQALPERIFGDRAWPRISSTPSANCSARCAAVSPTPSSSSAPCSPRRPASSPPR